MIDYTNQIIINGDNKKVKIIGYYGRNNKNERLWSYSCPYCNNNAHNTIYKIKRNKGCKNCTYDRVASSEMLSQEYVEKVIKNKNPNLILLSKYLGKHKDLKLFCKKHEIEFYSAASSALYHKVAPLCPKCKLEQNKIYNKKYTPEEIEKNLYNSDYVWLNKENYINASSVLKCQCIKCHNISHFNYSNFISGRRCKTCSGYATKSNETFQEEVFKLVGNEYSVLGEYKNGREKILMKHNVCGHLWEIMPINFLYGGKRCPMCCFSKGEQLIKKYLTSRDIEFQVQKKFNNLLGVGGRQLSYDFYLPKNNLLIEYQGEQHYKSTDYFGGEEKLKIQKEHDRRKKEFANNNNINLLEIRYDEFNEIENILKNIV